MSSVDGIVSVTVGSSYIEAPLRGATCDISFVDEDSDKEAKNSAPNNGRLKRQTVLGIIIAALVPVDMTAIEFERLLGRVEVAMATNDAFAPFLDDWFLAKTKWSYLQDSKASEIRAALFWNLELVTPTAEPGRAE